MDYITSHSSASHRDFWVWSFKVFLIQWKPNAAGRWEKNECKNRVSQKVCCSGTKTWTTQICIFILYWAKPTSVAFILSYLCQNRQKLSFRPLVAFLWASHRIMSCSNGFPASTGPCLDMIKSHRSHRQNFSWWRFSFFSLLLLLCGGKWWTFIGVKIFWRSGACLAWSETPATLHINQSCGAGKEDASCSSLTHNYQHMRFTYTPVYAITRMSKCIYHMQIYTHTHTHQAHQTAQSSSVNNQGDQ